MAYVRMVLCMALDHDFPIFLKPKGYYTLFQKFLLSLENCLNLIKDMKLISFSDWNILQHTQKIEKIEEKNNFTY